MTVAELIEIPKTHPQDLQVAKPQWSEYRLLEARDIGVEEHCHLRNDGWIGWQRDDKPSQSYLMIGKYA